VLLTYAFYALTAYFFIVLLPTYGDVSTISRTTKDGFYPKAEIVNNTFPLIYKESEVSASSTGPRVRVKSYDYTKEDGHGYLSSCYKDDSGDTEDDC
jgi:hypothetical protein